MTARSGAMGLRAIKKRATAARLLGGFRCAHFGDAQTGPPRIGLKKMPPICATFTQIMAGQTTQETQIITA